MGIKELAKYLNISIGTVSRALNNHPEVNAETRRRVLEAAAQLGYAPDQAGRSLRKGTIGTIAFILSTDRTGKQDAMFFMELSRGIQDVLARHDLDLVLHLNKPGDTMIERVRRVVERRQADGLILAETQLNDPRLDYLTARAFPFSALGRSLSDGNHPWIDLDFAGAMRDAIDRLVGFGHRRIALVTGENPGLMLDRLLAEAYRTELARHDIPFDPELLQAFDPDENGGYRAADCYLSLAEPPTAVLFPHYRAVSGAYARLTEGGLRPGYDLAILSVSADTLMAQYMWPALTCFQLDVYALGGALGEALLSSMPRFADEYGGSVIQKIWPWKIIGRDSDAQFEFRR